MFIFLSLEALSAADPFVNKGDASRNLSYIISGTATLSCLFEWNVKITAQNVKRRTGENGTWNRTNVKKIETDCSGGFWNFVLLA